MKQFNTPEALMNFMNHNITYGWIDRDFKVHNNTLRGFRDNYITMGVEDVFKHGVGTCLEQSWFQKVMLEQMNYKVKMYALRSFDLQKDTSDKIKMHCFTIYFDQEKVFHFEHANPDKVGIHAYNSEEEAITGVLDYFRNRDDGQERDLTLFEELPIGVSFNELNNYIDKVKVLKK